MWPVPASTRLDTPRGHGETVYTGRVTFRGTMGNQARAATGLLGLEGEGRERLPQAGQGRCEGRRPAPAPLASGLQLPPVEALWDPYGIPGHKRSGEWA